jgi:hypothetical protein
MNWACTVEIGVDLEIPYLHLLVSEPYGNLKIRKNVKSLLTEGYRWVFFPNPKHPLGPQNR